MSDNEIIEIILPETVATPRYPLLSSYCFNIYDLLQHELDRLNATNPEDLVQQDLQQRKILNELGIDKYFQYADVAFGVLENGYFLHAISSSAHLADYDREMGEFHAIKHLNARVWEMSAFAIKNEAAGDGTEECAVHPPVHYPMVDTWKSSNPRAIVTQGMGNEVNMPRAVMINVGHLLGWVYGTDQVNEHYKDVIMAIGVLPNGFVVTGTHQAYDHASYDHTRGLMDAYSDLERECLKYRLWVAKDVQHEMNRLQSIDRALDTFDEVPVPRGVSND